MSRNNKKDIFSKLWNLVDYVKNNPEKAIVIVVLFFVFFGIIKSFISRVTSNFKNSLNLLLGKILPGETKDQEREKEQSKKSADEIHNEIRADAEEIAYMTGFHRDVGWWMQNVFFSSISNQTAKLSAILSKYSKEQNVTLEAFYYWFVRETTGTKKIASGWVPDGRGSTGTLQGDLKTYLTTEQWRSIRNYFKNPL